MDEKAWAIIRSSTRKKKTAPVRGRDAVRLSSGGGDEPLEDVANSLVIFRRRDECFRVYRVSVFHGLPNALSEGFNLLVGQAQVHFSFPFCPRDLRGGRWFIAPLRR